MKNKEVALKYDCSEKIPKCHKKILKHIYHNKYQFRFTEEVYKYYDPSIDKDAWHETIQKLTNVGYLKKYYEIICPNCNSSMVEFKDMKDAPNIVQCLTCGKLSKTDQCDVFITYSDWRNS